MAIGYGDVAEAANKLKEEGSKISTRSIRLEIGSGSLSTINRHLSTWKEKEQQKSDESHAEVVSDELKNLISSEIASALKKAKSQLQTRIEDLQNQLKETNSQLSEQEKKATHLEKQNSELRAENKSLKEEVTKLLGSVENARKQCSDAQIKAAQAEAKSELAESSKAEISTTVRSLRDELEKKNDLLIKVDRERAVALARLEEREKK